jgi:phosphatidate phosphatase APP1
MPHRHIGLLERLTTELREEVERTGKALGLRRRAPFEIVPYRGYGNARRVLVHGRALHSPGVSISAATDSAWRNLLNTYRRIDAEPLPHARVAVRIGEMEREIVADDEGFFREWIDLTSPLGTDVPWQQAELTLVAPTRPDQGDVRATAPIRMLSPSATFGVISDLDDTVIQSRITSFLQAVRTVMLGNARTRLPFPGVAAFYQALERGGDGAQRNPIFYVSSSPWNIHDIIAEFMDLQRIPMGPIHLRDWDIGLSVLSRHRLRNHKEPLICEILDLEPTIPFILIGDDSQKDPEIYRGIIDRYPGRIQAVYIRNVRVNPERSASVRALAEQVLAAGSTLILADDTYAAAKHAAEHGWITRESLPNVKEEKRADTGETGEKSDAPGTTPDGAARTVVVE